MGFIESFTVDYIESNLSTLSLNKSPLEAMIGPIIVGSIHPILSDELIMGCAQRRIGPFNLGGYGSPSPPINGRNPIIPQFPVPKLHFHFGSQSFPISFPPFPPQNHIPPYPFSPVDIYPPLIILIRRMGLSIVRTIFPASPSRSKYSMSGCIRIIPQLISLESIRTTIILIFIRS